MYYLYKQPEDLTDGLLEQLMQQLPAWRRERALAFKHTEGRWQSAQSYLLLRQALREEFGIDTDEPFAYGPHGKPYLPSFPHIHFNISHCRGVVMCAVALHEVGCDVECMDRKVTDSLMRHCLSGAEMESVVDASCPNERFLQLWTRKEAFVKMSGDGLATDIPGLLTTPEAGKTKFLTKTDSGLNVVWSLAEKME